MRWNIPSLVISRSLQRMIVLLLLVPVAFAAVMAAPACADNTTQTVSPTQTTALATTAVTTATTSSVTTQVTNTVTSPVTTTVTATQTTATVTSQTTTVTTTVAQSPVNPVVAFNGDTTEGPVPLTVQFTDLSTGGPVSWSWDFGDGTSDTSQNPSHTYSEAGTYTVRMTATTRTGSSSLTREDYIVVEPAPATTATPTTSVTQQDASNLLAAFDGTPRTGTAPLTVVFTDTSVGTPVYWFWDFGDDKTDIIQNPVHTYREPGTYTVTLQVNSSGSGKKVKQVDFITVTSAEKTVLAETTSDDTVNSNAGTRSTAMQSGSVTTRQTAAAKTTTPSPTLTGKAWLEHQKQKMAEADALAATQQKKDFFSQIIDLIRGLIPFI